jgi:very-short-patch-repair endonuclease
MNATEQRLWRELRKLDANFRRQAPIGPYFADFASYGPRLVIEVDGGVHQRIAEVATRDRARQAWLESQGYRVLRFTDRQVHGDVNAVVGAISEALLLDGGGLGGGASAEVTRHPPLGAGAERRSLHQRPAHTTIPGPSSIEEEGGVLL